MNKRHQDGTVYGGKSYVIVGGPYQQAQQLTAPYLLKQDASIALLRTPVEDRGVVKGIRGPTVC